MPAIIKRDHVRDQEPGSLGSSPAAQSPRRKHKKTVELLRVEGRVEAIELVCACGEKTLIELDYEQAIQAPEDEEAADAS